MTEYKAGDRFLDKDGDLWQVPVADASKVVFVRGCGRDREEALKAARIPDDSMGYHFCDRLIVGVNHGPLTPTSPDPEVQQTTQDVPSETTKHGNNKPGDRFIDRDGDTWQVVLADTSQLASVRKGDLWTERALGDARNPSTKESCYFLTRGEVEEQFGPLVSTTPDPLIIHPTQDVPSGGTKHDGSKPRMDLLDGPWLEGTARILTFGAQKYAAHNWRGGIAQSRLFAALMRHMWAYWKGEDTDPETGESHLYHASCCLMFLDGMRRARPDLDDRYKEES